MTNDEKFQKVFGFYPAVRGCQVRKAYTWSHKKHLVMITGS